MTSPEIEEWTALAKAAENVSTEDDFCKVINHAATDWYILALLARKEYLSDEQFNAIVSHPLSGKTVLREFVLRKDLTDERRNTIKSKVNFCEEL